METCSAHDIAGAVGGKVLSGPSAGVFGGVSTDSRRVAGGEVFFALKGPNFDGHAFVGMVASKGASGAVVGKDSLPSDLPRASVIAVDDTTAALGALPHGTEKFTSRSRDKGAGRPQPKR